MVDDHAVDLPPARNMLVVRNSDTPGMIAVVATALAEAGVNIDDMALGRSRQGAAALQVLATAGPVPDEVIERIRASDGIVSVNALS
jgi:predicted regulator of amino acid metabolism with ACT domain